MNGKSPSRPVLALTVGEPAGIGLDITIDAWIARMDNPVPPFAFVGPARLLEARAKLMNRQIKTGNADAEDPAQMFKSAIPCLGDWPALAIEPGRADPFNAGLVTESIETAVGLVHEGQCSAVVTNPINKEVLSTSGFAYPGHTEFLGSLSERIFNIPARPVMMLAAPDLRTVPVTVHIPLRRVFDILTTEIIVETGRIVAGDLRSRFGISNPRLAISGLNPHAGENGLMGSEDQDIILPAVQQLNDEGLQSIGPLPADTLFHQKARRDYDAALCMYHDQALIPVKTLAFDSGVNVTLGLPFVRTSPDHGTAFDLAGSGKADPSSLVAALNMAAQMTAQPAR